MCEFNPNFMKNAWVGWTFTTGMYFPPDFDHTKILPMKRLKGKQGPRQMNMRMIMPFTMYCEKCGYAMYIGTKFNSKCEPTKDEAYMGMRVYRFYGKCKECMHEFIFKTDPENNDYTLEAGGTRSYEAWRDANAADGVINAEKEQERRLDAMKELEQKTYDLAEEMARMDQLDELMRIQKRLKSNDTGSMALDAWLKKQAAEADAVPDFDSEDDDEVEQLLALQRAKDDGEELAGPKKDGEVEEKDPLIGLAPEPERKEASLLQRAKPKFAVKRKKADAPAAAPAAKVAKCEGEKAETKPKVEPKAAPAPVGLGLAYSSGDSD